MTIFDYDFSLKEKIYTIEEASELLSISVATCRNWIRLGLLKDNNLLGANQLSYAAVNELKDKIENGSFDKLKSRRNKKFLEGNIISKSYLKNRNGYQKVVEIIETIEQAELNSEVVRVILAEYSLKLLHSHFDDGILLENNELLNSDMLVSDLLNSNLNLDKIIKEYKNTLEISVDNYNEDFLGLLYMSLSNISDRKSSGVYYTPKNLVEKTISDLNSYGFKPNSKFLDPACGTGNFLMELLRIHGDYTLLYGYDIDEISVKLCRINIAIMTKEYSYDVLTNNIRIENSLNIKSSELFDYIIGNPPWGSDFTEEEKKEYLMLFHSTGKSTIEAFSLFLEKSFELVKPGGKISFILPEAILMAKTHVTMRDYLKCHSKLLSVIYWGNAFDGVQSPAVTLTVAKENSIDFFSGGRIEEKNKIFILDGDSSQYENEWPLNANRLELQIIENIHESNVVYLKDNANFALGIVTGDNKKHLLSTEITGSQEILKGNDLYKFNRAKAKNFIKYNPNQYQQVAKGEPYFTSEKLIYRFISDSLVFSYDNNQTLTLNSANIMIPLLESLSTKYILAILNSSFATFYYKKKFKSIKVLRKHIEDIPIINASKEEQLIVEAFVDELLSKDCVNPCKTYKALDNYILDLYSFSEDEKVIIKTSYSEKFIMNAHS